MRRARNSYRWLGLGLYLILVSCSEGPVFVDAAYPLERILLYPEYEAFLTLAQGVSIETFVDLDPFRRAGVAPAMTLEDARRVLGREPDRTERSRPRETVYGYEVPEGSIQIVLQIVQSEGPETESWFVRLVPRPELESLFDHSILEQIPEERQRNQSIKLIGGPNKRDMAKLILDEEGNLRYLWWLSREADGPPP